MRKDKPQEASALAAFVDALLQSGGQLMLIVDHMSRHPGEGEASVDEVLRSLLKQVLAPELGGREEELEAAAATLAAATEAIGQEILLTSAVA